MWTTVDIGGGGVEKVICQLSMFSGRSHRKNAPRRSDALLKGCPRVQLA